MKIAITTLYTPEIADFSKEAVKNFRMYCDLHDYDLFAYEESLIDGLRGNWCKPKVLLDHINDYDYIVWLDSDIAILDINRKLEEIIEPHKEKLFIATDDMGGWKLNNGFMIFKNTKFVKDFLSILWKQQSGFKDKERGDQKFFIDFIDKINLPETQYHLYPQSEICAPPFLKNETSFSVHVMGIHINEVRTKYIQHINQEISERAIKQTKLHKKQKQFIELKDQWINFKDYDFFDCLSKKITKIFPPQEKFTTYNPGKKIAIVSLYTPEIADYAVCSEMSVRDYCLKQGYTFYVYREKLDAHASANWSKARAILNHFDDHEDVVWMDSDTIIYNPQKRFEDILARCTGTKKIIACEDIGANNKKIAKGMMLNSGVVIFRNHFYTKNIIKKWMNAGCDKSSLYASGGDQGILCDILKKSDGFGFNRKIFPMNEFNTEPRFVDENTFILHFMAYPYELKKIFMRYFVSD
jgi:hypothetical protein